VLDIHPVLRALLLNLVILPFRPAKSAAAYRKVWSDRGSPLLHHSIDLVAAVQARLGADWAVRLGMRYGNPAIGDALAELVRSGCERLVVMPLYPQVAMSSTGTSLHAVFSQLAELPTPLPVCVIEPFYDDPQFLAAFVARATPVIEREHPDHVLFSFHGLPERQIRKADPSGSHCLASPDCCARISRENRGCYRAQCFATARAMADRLGLSADRYSVSFQSRLGRTPWISPYTDVVFGELIAQGKKRLVVVCPAFVTDCLETLEEIAIRGREDFLEAGGESLEIVPSLNSEPAWADAVVELVRRQSGRFAPTKS
jgi:ferrochelatase